MPGQRVSLSGRLGNLTGMQAVVTLWIGQLVSLAGTGMTRFAMTIWVWQQTERATAVALIWVAAIAPAVVLGPAAGTLVDRWNRKTVMIVADLVAGAATVGLLLLYAMDSLQIWHLYLAGAIASVAESFQAPAQMASVTMMVPSEQLTRANGIMSMAQFGSTVLSPALAGVLIGPVGIGGIMIADTVTFLLAVALLLPLRIPQPRGSGAGEEPKTLWQDTADGVRYVVARKPILYVMTAFLVGNLIFGIFGGLLSPMILARTAQDSWQLGLVLTMHGLGGVAGGLLLSGWRGPRRRIHGVLLGIVGMNLLGVVVVGLGRTMYLWALGAFFVTFFIPIMNGCVMAIGQAKVAVEIQGRVFGLLRTLAQASYPLALAMVGPLADHVFEPAMAQGGALTPIFAATVGTGPGAGMSLLMLLSGVVGCLAGAGAYLVASIRNVESLLPDQVPHAAAEGAGARSLAEELAQSQ